MSEFKGGEDVLFNEIEYVYIAKHPIFTNFSVIQAKHSKITSILGDITYVATDDIEKKPKTHKVNGFEVPEPVCAEEYEKLRHNQGFFCFDANDLDCCRNILAGDISIAAVKCGFVFKTEYDVKKNIAALQGIDPSTAE